MVKGFRQITLFTILSRILGFVRDMAFAYFIGAGRLFSSWVVAFMIPNLSRRLFGEGAATSSFIPVYNEELHKRPENAKFLAQTVVTVVAVILAGIVLVGEAVIWIYFHFFSQYPNTDLMLKLTSIMMPYMILICVVAILAGILQTHRHFAAPAAAPVLLNIFIIGSLCFSGWVISLEPEKQVFFVAVAIIIAGLSQLGLQLVPLKRIGVTLKPGWQVKSDAFKKILILMGPMILGLTVTQLNTLGDNIIAWVFSAPNIEASEQIRYPLPTGAVSYLYYSQRLYQFPLGVLGISLATAIFPVMSRDAAKGDMASLAKTISRGIKGCIFIALPATTGLILVRTILIQWAFERGEFLPSDTPLTATVLLFYSLGLCGFFLQQIVTRAFYSLQDSRVPAKTAVVAVCVNIILNLTLIWFIGTGGLALSTAFCSYLQVVILLLALRKRFDNTILHGLKIIFIKSAIATAIMYAAGIGILKLLPDREINFINGAIILAIMVVSCAAIYTITSKLLKNEMLGLLSRSN